LAGDEVNLNLKLTCYQSPDRYSDPRDRESTQTYYPNAHDYSPDPAHYITSDGSMSRTNLGRSNV
jgi:hypothetical protein